MAHKVRLFFENTAQHIVLRGTNQENIFIDHNDYSYGLCVLKELSVNLLVHVHAYVLMPNHLHLLCTPLEKDALSRFMQGFGIKYVAYFNRKYGRSGTLWEGRYKSSLVENRFVLPLMHYIESHPYRTRSVPELTPYLYSSFARNATACVDGIVTPHLMYVLLASSDEQRANIYASLYHQGLSEALLHFFRHHIVKQTIIGTQEFYQELEQKIGINLHANKIGRPNKKSTFKRSNTMYQNLVVLDREKHKDLKISPMANLNFAKSLTSTPLLVNEAALVAKDFPVVFTGGEKSSLVALTSLGGTNLAINTDGKYIVSYVPAFLRSYPFTLSKNQENSEQQLILIDEGSELVSQSKGKQLFTKDGQQSEALSNAIAFLQNFETERQKTESIINIIVQSGILEDREITVGEGESKKILVDGFKIVDREKLNALGDDILADWVRRGIISFLDAHASSLNHIQTLFNLASAKQSI